MHRSPPTGALRTTDADSDRAAFDRIAAERAAVDLSKAPRYTLEAVHAVSTALAIVRRLQPHRPDLARLHTFDIAHLDRFEDYAHALWYAHISVLVHVERVRLPPALVEEGKKLRGMLLQYGDLLVLNDVVAADVMTRLRDGAGHLDLIGDLRTLSRLYLDQPELLGPGSPISPAMVYRAVEVASAMTLAYGTRGDDPVYRALLEDRRRVATLLLRSHGQLRRAMEFLRYDHGDAATLVPSLYAPRKKKRRKTRDTPDDAA